MEAQRHAHDEIVIKEYPHYTRWLDGREVLGTGNLILTTERLVFLYLVYLSDEQKESISRFSAGASTRDMVNNALSLHKKNFQVPLNSITLVKTGLFSTLPFPRPCLRIEYQSDRKKKNVKNLSFMFTIPLWKGWFQLEITTVMTWVRIIKMAVKAAMR